MCIYQGVGRDEKYDTARRVPPPEPDNFVGLEVGVGYVARDLRNFDFRIHVRKRGRGFIAGLGFENFPVDGFAIEARRSACLQACHWQLRITQLDGEFLR